MDKVHRDYMWCSQDFQEMLDKFNKTIEHEEIYECVGYANVRLRFCFLCFDAEKRKGKELYYVNKVQVDFHRRNICHGCLGHKLRKFSS